MPDDPSLPSWLRGKTPSEVAALYTPLAQAAARNVAYQDTQYRTPTPYEAPAAAHNPSGPPDPALNYSDPVEYARQLNAYYDLRLQQGAAAASAPILARQAETEKHLSRGGTYSDVWRRWEPEIEAELAGIPLHERNRLLYDKAAEIVQGRHWRDLAREEAEKMAASGGGSGTERTHGGGGYGAGMPANDPIETFLNSDHPYAKATVANGVKAADVRAHCAMMKITPDEWLQNAQAGSLIANANSVTRSFA